MRKPELVPGVADFICTHVVTRVVLQPSQCSLHWGPVLAGTESEEGLWAAG